MATDPAGWSILVACYLYLYVCTMQFPGTDLINLWMIADKEEDFT